MSTGSPARKRPILGLAAVMLTVTLWSGSNVIAKAISVPGLVVSFYRLWFAIALLWVVVACSPSLRRRLTREWLIRSLWGGFFFGLHQALFFESLKATSVANVLIIFALQPVLVLFVSSRLLGERVSWGGVIWTSVAIVGIVAVVLGSLGAPHWSAFGDFLAVLNLFAFFFYFLVSKKARRILGALEYTIGITTFAGLFVSAVALVSGADLASPKGYEWAVLLFIAIIPGTGGHFLFNWAHAHTTALVVAIMGLLVPVLASAGAFVFLNENLSTWQLVGGSIVLLATGMVARMRH